MSNLIFLFAVVIQLSCIQHPENKSATTGLTADSCDDPDAPVSCCFQNMPATVNHFMKIPHAGSGTPMLIKGVIQNKEGTPLKGVTLYAYHTDEKGVYSKKGDEKGVQKWHGQHHGWAITNEKGEYEIHSIRPAKYPDSNGPAHIHAAIKLPGKSAQWISDFVFKDDPAVKGSYSSSYPGGSGVVDVQLSNKQWEGTRQIILNN